MVEQYVLQAADALDNARRHLALRESDRRKEEFLATLAHELRNPLAAIQTAAQVLRPDALDEAMLGEVRDMIVRQTGHMARLVEDLLDATRISRGTIAMRKEPVDFAAVAARAVEDVRPLVEARCAPTGRLLAGGAPDHRRRPHPARAGAGEPPDQRRQVHRPGRPHRPGRRPRGRGAGRAGARHRHRPEARGPLWPLQAVHPGRRGARPQPRRTGHRPGAGQEPGRAARRLGLGPQRRAGHRQRVHRPAARRRAAAAGG